jgi:hypothetical protein
MAVAFSNLRKVDPEEAPAIVMNVDGNDKICLKARRKVGFEKKMEVCEI